MKPLASNAPPRRLASPKKQVQLNLRRRTTPPEPEDDVETKKERHFWKWVVLVALFHLAVLALVCLFYAFEPKTQPVEQFMELLPVGDEVKGTAAIQSAPKTGQTTPRPSAEQPTPPPIPAPPKPKPPVAVHPTPTPPPVPTPTPPPQQVEPPPIIKPDVPPVIPDKPITPQPTAVKPPPPKPKPKPQVKVDLSLADGPATPDKHVAKPKPTPHPKPVTADTATTDNSAAATPDNTGLSKAEIAEKLGKNLDQAGTTKSNHTGVSGSKNAKPNSYSEFYAMIRDQVLSQWASPLLSDEAAVPPIVQIHVEKDGRVPPESVQLIQSSNNKSYDDSAVAAAKGLGYLHEPLPDGCPPDIPITFKLTR